MDETLKNSTILIVDDTKTNLDILGDALKPLYKISVALNGKSALTIAKRVLPDLILLDIMMPEIDGYEVCRQLKGEAATENIPVIFLTALDQVDAKSKGFELGAVDYVTKPFEIMEVQARVKTHLLLKAAQDMLKQQNEVLEVKVRERTRELMLTRDVTIQSLSSLAETRDNETGGHIRRTQNYVTLLAENLQSHPRFSTFLNRDTREILGKTAPLHDIGKVGVPDRILLKPGKLDPKEFEEMKLHTVYGKQALFRAETDLGTNSFLNHARQFAYSHHEKWDGSGYPDGSAGEEIPCEGRLMAVADVYDALISKRVYKPSFPHTKAVEIIINEREKHFDPVVIDCFSEITEQFREAALQFADDDEQRQTLLR